MEPGCLITLKILLMALWVEVAASVSWGTARASCSTRLGPPTVLTREAWADRSGRQWAPSAGAGQLVAARRLCTRLSCIRGAPCRGCSVRLCSGLVLPHPSSSNAALLPAFCHRYHLFFKLPSRQPQRQPGKSEGSSRPTLTRAPPAGPSSTSHKVSPKESRSPAGGPACSAVDLWLDREADVCGV